MSDALPSEELMAQAAQVMSVPGARWTRLAHGLRLGVTAGVWRVQTEDKSAVVKLISPGHDDPQWRGSHTPGNYRYWPREALIYAVGLPVSWSDAGVHLPPLLGSFELANGDRALWLEDISGTGGTSWSIERTAWHCQRIGLAQGWSTLDPSWQESPVPWSCDALRDYLDTPEATSADIDWERLDDRDAWNSPLMRRHFDPDLQEAVLSLCRDRYTFTRWGSLLPVTLAHHDLWPNNLFEAADRTYLIDWAFAGTGWLGGDIGNFVSDTALDLLRPAAELPALESAVFDSYLAGLRAAGWSGDERLVRLGMCLIAAKWTWLIPVMLKRAARSSEHTVYGSQVVDAENLYSERAQVFRMLVRWADEARDLMDQLQLDPAPKFRLAEGNSH